MVVAPWGPDLPALPEIKPGFGDWDDIYGQMAGIVDADIVCKQRQLLSLIHISFTVSGMERPWQSIRATPYQMAWTGMRTEVSSITVSYTHLLEASCFF